MQLDASESYKQHNGLELIQHQVMDSGMNYSAASREPGYLVAGGQTILGFASKLFII